MEKATVVTDDIGRVFLQGAVYSWECWEGHSGEDKKVEHDAYMALLVHTSVNRCERRDIK